MHDSLFPLTLTFLIGICALETLSKVAAEQAAKVDEHDSPRSRTATPVRQLERTSIPLVPLANSHKRPRSRSREPSKTLRPSDSGVHKVNGKPGSASTS